MDKREHPFEEHEALAKIYEVINNVYSNKYSSNQQEESLATYCKKIKK